MFICLVSSQVFVYFRGVRTSNSQPSSVNVASSNGPSKQKADTCTGSLAFSTVVANPTQVSAVHSDVQKKPNEAVVAIQKGKLELAASEKADQRITSYTRAAPEHPITSIPTIQYMDSLKDKDGFLNMVQKSEKVDRGTTSYTPVTPGHAVTSVPATQYTDSLKDKDDLLNMSHDLVRPNDYSDRSRSIAPEREPIPVVEPEIQKVCSDMLSLRIDGPRLQRCISEQHKDPMCLNGASNAMTSCRDAFVSREHSELRSHEQSKVADSANSEFEDDLLSFNVQRIKDPEVVSHRSNLPSLPQSFNYTSRISPANVSADPLTVDKKNVDKGSFPKVHNIPLNSNGHFENLASGFAMFDNGDRNSYMPSDGGKHAVDDIGESSIISNILSMDFDSWDDSLGSPQNLARLLGEAENQQGPLGISNSWKVQTSNQSRFSFARENDEVPKFEPSLSNFSQAPENHDSFGNGFVSNGDYYLGKSNDLSAFSVVETGNFANVHSLGSHKFSGQHGLLSFSICYMYPYILVSYHTIAMS